MIYANTTRFEPAQEQARMDYVTEGGGLVAVHCASAAFGNSDRFIALLGGRFRSHRTGTFRPRNAVPTPPVMQGFESFESWDETYVHDRHNKAGRTVLEIREAKIQRPLAAAKSMEHVVVPGGFELELFAAEPDIKKAVTMAWDERGRAWIVETVDYPNRLVPPGQPGNDRIVLAVGSTRSRFHRAQKGVRRGSARQISPVRKPDQSGPVPLERLRRRCRTRRRSTPGTRKNPITPMRSESRPNFTASARIRRCARRSSAPSYRNRRCAN